ncbi:hypothetical protein Afil01_11270 [Actinorhabdospora filicis]|uniref:DUF3499 domain-containing protein n=1 Tax=Actinorhabdospora filicis TaxID=1785913 RepID=A0A9W6SHZ3_9ACTN|nr:DUF3499 domain-containing protein [Actinorhabdospora filicis]GLZ76320.1 hypothetical protein Afil01_11270 [Actinorhabdospora filicis]
MRSHRLCSRNGCRNSAVATLTYIYVDSTAVVGPLATSDEPHSYDLCETHATRLTAPRGWDLVRHEGEYAAPEPSTDDLVALAEAVREAARPRDDGPPELPFPDAPARRDPPPQPPSPAPRDANTGRRGHLRIVDDR